MLKLRLAARDSEIIRETGALLRLMEPLVKDSQFVDLDKCEAHGPASGNMILAFLGQLRSVGPRLNNFCAEGNFNRDSINAIGDMMDTVAELFSSAGDVQTGEKIRQGRTFIERLAVSGGFITTQLLDNLHFRLSWRRLTSRHLELPLPTAVNREISLPRLTLWRTLPLSLRTLALRIFRSSLGWIFLLFSTQCLPLQLSIDTNTEILILIIISIINISKL